MRLHTTRVRVELNLPPRPLRLSVTMADHQEPYLSCLGTDALDSREMHDTIFFDVLDIRRPSESVEGFPIEVALSIQDR